MTYWLAQTYLKIFDHKFTVKGECGNGKLQARLNGDVIILRGYVRRNSGPFGGRENWHGYNTITVSVPNRTTLYRRAEPESGVEYRCGITHPHCSDASCQVADRENGVGILAWHLSLSSPLPLLRWSDIFKGIQFSCLLCSLTHVQSWSWCCCHPKPKLLQTCPLWRAPDGHVAF